MGIATEAGGKAARKVAREDLQLRELVVVYPGSREYALAEGVRALPLAAVTG